MGLRKLSNDEQAVQTHFLEQMDPRLKALRRSAIFDLHFGPHPPGGEEYISDDLKEWPGYVKAVEELEDWADDNLSTVFYCTQTGEITTTEPDEEPEDWVRYERKALYLIVFRELVSDGGMS